MIPTERQFREGRKLAGLSQAKPASAADVTVGLLVRIEGMDWLPMIIRRGSAAIQQALEASGVEFVEEDGGALKCGCGEPKRVK